MSAKILHHLDPATLMAYSAGTLGEALSAVAGAHIEMCAVCRRELADLDMVGASLLDALAPRAGEEMRRDAMPDRGSASVVELLARKRVSAVAPDAARGPVVFASRIGVDLDKVPWRRLGPGIRHYSVRLSKGVQGDLRLLEISAGKRMPCHGHGGTELTLVLDGTYRDEKGEYRCGDIQDIDGEGEHVPLADEATGCVCIIASERPARYRSLLNRLLQPLTGI